MLHAFVIVGDDPHILSVAGKANGGARQRLRNGGRAELPIFAIHSEKKLNSGVPRELKLVRQMLDSLKLFQRSHAKGERVQPGCREQPSARSNRPNGVLGEQVAARGVDVQQGRGLEVWGGGRDLRWGARDSTCGEGYE